MTSPPDPGAPPSAASAPPALPPLDVSQHLRVMPLGDSITAGAGSSTGDGYRLELARYMVEVQQLYTATWVGSQTSGQQSNPRHEGHPGWRIDELTPHVPEWMAAASPDLVLLHCGVNDARAGACAGEMAARMTDLLAAILATSPTLRVVVSDLIAPWYGTQNDIASIAVQQFNALLPDVVAAAGPRVSLVRVSLAVPSGLLGDGLHPTDEGYLRMAWALWRALGRLLADDGITRAGRDPLPVPIPLSVLCPT